MSVLCFVVFAVESVVEVLLVAVLGPTLRDLPVTWIRGESCFNVDRPRNETS